MQALIRKYAKIIAIFVGIAMMAPIITLYQNQIRLSDAKAIAINEEDKQIAADISNMTGETIENILKLKKSGKTWNDILETLKKENPKKNRTQGRTHSTLLTRNGFDEKTIKRLQKEGFDQQDILEAKLIAERVLFALQEITSQKGSSTPVETPSAAVTDPLLSQKEEKGNEDLASYASLLEKIDLEEAVTFMLTLQEDFGSMEKVLDEYLLCLQIGIDLGLYSKDQEAYQKQKEEKTRDIAGQTILTLAAIQEKMLAAIQEENRQDLSGITGKPPIPQPAEPMQGQEPDILPQNPLPKIDDVKPQNPAEAIRKEIEAIQPTDYE